MRQVDDSLDLPTRARGRAFRRRRARPGQCQPTHQGDENEPHMFSHQNATTKNGRHEGRHEDQQEDTTAWQ
jgi:hypothetical protein